MFHQNRYHDQVRYSFLMPVFVVGSWDVISPQEILPEWDPPAPYIKTISLKNFLPFWEMGIVGKLLSLAAVAGILLMVLLLGFPTLGIVIKGFFSGIVKQRSNI